MRQILICPQRIRLLVGLISVFALVCESAGQKQVVLPAGAGQRTQTPIANKAIQSKWSEVVDGLSMRVNDNAKSRWGSAESPTFIIQLKNTSKQAQEITVTLEDLALVVNQQEYRWNAPGTTLISKINAGETRDNFFILRITPAQWRPDASTRETQNELPGILETGAKEFEFKIRIGKNKEDSKTVSTGKIKFEITKNLFELPTVGGVLLGKNGNPVSSAEIYLCKDAQFSIFYSNYDGNWFKSKSVSHYDPSGGFSSLIKPVKTNEKGEFLLSPGSRDKRLVVIPANGSAQVFDLPKSFSDWKVKLKPTGALIIEHNIKGEDSTNNAS
ncbi:MAG: hypothetical protein VX438_17430, partial [Planctomycetota bacterium]|nr:hypothetical protein [Planctomycetota bacterium]